MRILFLGDIHGNFNLIKQYVNRFDIKDAYIIQVGDFGVGFDTLYKEKSQLELINSELVKSNVFLYAIRGNHDRPSYFENDPFSLSNIKLISDYTVLELEGKRILCIGGAVSIDRAHRITDAQKNGDHTYKHGQSWFKGEEFNLDIDILEAFRDINIVVTHTSPDYCTPDNSLGFGSMVNNWINIDPNLKLDLMDERRKMSIAFEIIKRNNKITNHLYGHFHFSNISKFDGVEHRLLGVGELYEEI